MSNLDSYLDPSTPEFWLHRLVIRLQNRQDRYELLQNYVIGNHPLPNGDPRFKIALQDFQLKARTNYVGLANKAVTDRMSLVGFKFSAEGEVDEDAKKIWRYNNMNLKHKLAISDAAKFSDTYALVAPPREPGGQPLITVEDPRMCIVEEDPSYAGESLAGLKFYNDTVLGVVTAIVYLPDATVVYQGPTLSDFNRMDLELFAEQLATGTSAFIRTAYYPNPIGKVQLVRGCWRPEYGIRGMAECEDGGFDVQDRINTTVLMRMVIAKSQAFRQRWVTGGMITQQKQKNGKGPPRPPFEPSADAVWAMLDPDAKFGDFEQADIRQLLEAVRDDVGDFAAITQTPVTALTNKMVNVSGSTLTIAQATLISKVRTRMESMGLFFEQVMRLAFAYKGDAKADDPEAEVLWADPELRTMAEVSDFISKTAPVLPPRLYLERAGFTPDEVEMGVEEIEKMKEQAMQNQITVAKETQAQPGQPGGGANSGAKPSAAAKKPAAKPSGTKPKK